ncbi:PEP-CTERM sorting domain-containing protein [Schlesneria sp. T3-172]|uniref:PEP-CTERM sorting domain-containing protein n=1 Tax=Schlesneria sphaerica TaxID=3373610 RepID=UPI0037CB3944
MNPSKLAVFVVHQSMSVIVAAFLLGAACGPVHAGTISAPSGLKYGDAFRIIFVTAGTTDATSTHVADYDDFVNSQANSATYNGSLVHWSVVGSTDTVNAYQHIGESSAGVYMVDGTKVANSTIRGLGNHGLWSCDLLAQPTAGIDGTVFSGVTVWTGTAGNGVTYETINGKFGLGSTNHGPNNYFGGAVTEVGRVPGAGPISYDWVEAGGIPSVHINSQQYQMYAISDVLVYSVPEPSSFALAVLGGIGLAFSSSRKRRLAD